MTGYYDIVLGAIPLALAGITTLLMALGVQLTTAVQIGSLVAVALIGHAMFVRSPVDLPASSQSPNDPPIRPAE